MKILSQSISKDDPSDLHRCVFTHPLSLVFPGQRVPPHVVLPYRAPAGDRNTCRSVAAPCGKTCGRCSTQQGCTPSSTLQRGREASWRRALRCLCLGNETWSINWWSRRAPRRRWSRRWWESPSETQTEWTESAPLDPTCSCWTYSCTYCLDDRVQFIHLEGNDTDCVETSRLTANKG